jgi:hypothetical protein
VRDGYNRDALKHCNADANPTDGCSTRAEVLLAEAVTAPTVGAHCALTGGSRLRSPGFMSVGHLHRYRPVTVKSPRSLTPVTVSLHCHETDRSQSGPAGGFDVVQKLRAFPSSALPHAGLG